MLFRSIDWKARPKRVFVARVADVTEAQVVIVLTNGGSLKFHTRQRAYEYAVGWMQCPLKVMAQAWWLLDITEVRSLPAWIGDPRHRRVELLNSD